MKWPMKKKEKQDFVGPKDKSHVFKEWEKCQPMSSAAERSKEEKNWEWTIWQPRGLCQRLSCIDLSRKRNEVNSTLPGVREKWNGIRAFMGDIFIWLFFFKKNLFHVSLEPRQSSPPSPDQIALSVCWQGSFLGRIGAVSDKFKLDEGAALGFDSD